MEEGGRPGTLSSRNVSLPRLLKVHSRMKKPSHSTVVAYLALFVALGGSAYAVSKIDSGDIKNRSIKGKDVASDALGARQIDERKLSPPTGAGSEAAGPCNPTGEAAIDCIVQTIRTQHPSSVVVVATGSKDAVNGSGICSITVDGSSSADRSLEGGMRDGFAITKTTAPLPAGSHTVALRCTESNPDLTIDNPTIAAIAVNTQR